MMKKYLLGAMMLVGAMTYAQGNQVIVPIDEAGNATANIGIEVSGEVFDPTQKMLIVEIKSSATPDGGGFAFQMPDLFKNTTSGTTSETITGKFVARVEQNGKPVALTQGITVGLVTGTSNDPAATVTSEAMGTAINAGDSDNGKITVNYTVSGASKANDFEHNGTLAVSTTLGKAVNVGTYSDNSVRLRVAVTGQK